MPSQTQAEVKTKGIRVMQETVPKTPENFSLWKDKNDYQGLFDKLRKNVND